MQYTGFVELVRGLLPQVFRFLKSIAFFNMLYVVPVDGRLLLPKLLGGRRRKVLSPARSDLL